MTAKTRAVEPMTAAELSLLYATLKDAIDSGDYYGQRSNYRARQRSIARKLLISMGVPDTQLDSQLNELFRGVDD